MANSKADSGANGENELLSFSSGQQNGPHTPRTKNQDSPRSPRGMVQKPRQRPRKVHIIFSNWGDNLYLINLFFVCNMQFAFLIKRNWALTFRFGYFFFFGFKKVYELLGYVKSSVFYEPFHNFCLLFYYSVS